MSGLVSVPRDLIRDHAPDVGLNFQPAPLGTAIRFPDCIREREKAAYEKKKNNRKRGAVDGRI